MFSNDLAKLGFNLSVLNRHPWSRKFADWIKAQGFAVISTEMRRANGHNELLEIGKPRDPQRPTLVFLHGLGNDALFPNINLYRTLLTEGCNLIISDLDGHGQGLSSVFAEETLVTLVDDMVTHSQFLREIPQGLHLAGFSLGAILMLHYALRSPHNIKSLSMIGMPLILSGDLRIAWEASSPFLRSFRKGLRDYGIWGIQPALGPILRQRYPVRLGDNETSSYLEVAGRIIRSLAPSEKLRDLQCQSIYVAGSRDFISYPSVAANFLDDLKNLPNLRRKILPGETHFSIMLAPETPAIIVDLLRKTS